jgi:hypothetical protein
VRKEKKTQNQQLRELRGHIIRALREHFEPGKPREVFEAELRNDGLEHDFQSLEMGRSWKGQEATIPLLLKRWQAKLPANQSLSADDFLDQKSVIRITGKPLQLPGEEDTAYDVFGELVDIPLHSSTTTGKVSLLRKPTTSLKASADLANKKAFSVVVPNGDNAARFRKDRRVIFIPLDQYEDGKWVFVHHKKRTFRDESGQQVPEGFIRWKEWGNRGSVFKPLDPNADTFTEDEVEIQGMAVACRHFITGTWWIEERCDEGLPQFSPIVSS